MKKPYNNGLPRASSIRVLADPKQCTKCKESKPRSEFFHIWKDRPAVHSHCKVCQNATVEKYKSTRSTRYAKRNYYLAGGKIRLSVERFNEMLAEQNGGCAICGATEAGRGNARLLIDHCHLTKKVRGLLCHNCNTGISHFKENPALFVSALSYLAPEVT